ncbi:MAG: DUF945 domain-containing protein [Legionella sp.]|nr:MAG: DUF945 domain-containing protein [Legionella sp.]
MKKLTGLIIILAVLVLGGYYGMGMVTEKTIKSNLAVINQSNELFADVQEYNRGWFCSNAKIKWRMHLPERVVSENGQTTTIPAQDYQMEMPVKIYHGPFIFANKRIKFGMGYAISDIPFPEQYNKEFSDSFTNESVKPQVNLSIFVNYLNKSTVGLNLPTFKLVAKDGKGQFDWQGMTSTTYMSSNLSKVKGDLAVVGMTFNNADTRVTLGKVTSDYNLHKSDSGLYLGDASFNLPAFEVVVKDQKMFELKELAMSSDSDIDDSLFNMHLNLSLKSVLANGQNYGPGTIEVALRNLDADVLARLNDQAKAMQNGTELQRQQAVMAMLPELPKLFSKGAEFEISTLSLKLPEGDIDGNLFVALPKGDNNNPFELAQKIKGNAKIKIPVAVVKKLVQQSIMQQMSKQPDMQQALIQQLQSAQGQANQPAPTTEQLAAMQADKEIANFEQKGVIVVQGSDYVTEVSLEGGKFVVNGKPFDSSMVKF